MKHLKIIFLFLLAIQVSCTNEELAVEQQTSSNHTATINQNRADFTGRIKRVKIRKRRVGSGYKITTTTDITENAAHVSLSMERIVSINNGTQGEHPVFEDIRLDKIEGNDTVDKYSLQNIEFEDQVADGDLMRVTVQLTDIEGTPIDEPQQFEVIIEDETGIAFNNLNIESSSYSDNLTLSTTLKGDPIFEIATVTGALLYADNTVVPFGMEATTETENSITFENPVFQAPADAVSNIVAAQIIASNANNETIETSIVPINYSEYTGLNLGNATVNRYGDGVYDITVVLRGEQLPNVENMLLSLMSEDGTLSEQVNMNIKAEHENRRVYDYRGFGETSDFELDNSMKLVIKVDNSEGTMADYVRVVAVTEDEGITFSAPTITYNKISGTITKRQERIRASYKQRMQSVEVKVTFPDDDASTSVLDVLLEERDFGFNVTLENPTFIGATTPFTNVLSTTKTYDENGMITGQAEFEVPVTFDYGFKAKTCLINNEDGTHSIKVVLRGENKDDTHDISVQLYGDTMETEEYTLELIQQNETRNVYRINNIDLGGDDLDNIITYSNTNFYYTNYNDEDNNGALTVHVCHL